MLDGSYIPSEHSQESAFDRMAWRGNVLLIQHVDIGLWLNPHPPKYPTFSFETKWQLYGYVRSVVMCLSISNHMTENCILSTEFQCSMYIAVTLFCVTDHRRQSLITVFPLYFREKWIIVQALWILVPFWIINIHQSRWIPQINIQQTMPSLRHILETNWG
jgi:hypothetical protein